MMTHFHVNNNDYSTGSDSGYTTGTYSTTHTDSKMVSDPDARRSISIAKTMEIEHTKVQYNTIIIIITLHL